jgi:hypothetical protein
MKVIDRYILGILQRANKGLELNQILTVAGKTQEKATMFKSSLIKLEKLGLIEMIGGGSGTKALYLAK